jgi:hypothetical protein
MRNDDFLDSIDVLLENGEVPPKVSNRMLLAAIKINYHKSLDNHDRISALETFKTKAMAVLATAGFFWGVIITIVNLWIV